MNDQPVVPFVGLTGGMGAGKSTALAALEGLGAAVLSTDAIVHELYEGTRVRDAVLARWGEPVAPGGGAVDRAAVAARAFEDPAEREWLEGLLWPLVGERIAQWLQEVRAAKHPPHAAAREVPAATAQPPAATAQPPAATAQPPAATAQPPPAAIMRVSAAASPPRAAIVEVPLLFEAGMGDIFDATIAIVADEQLRRRRAAGRGHALADERLARQLSQEDKAGRATFAVRNDGTKEELVAKLSAILDKLEG